MPVPCEADRALDLVSPHLRVEHRLARHQLVQIDVVGHHADRGAHARALDERREHVGVFLHLEDGGHSAAQKFRHREAAEGLPLVAPHHHAHGQVQAVGGRMADVLRPPPEHRVPEMVVRAHEAGQRDAPLRFHHLASVRCAIRDLLTRSRIGDDGTVDEHRPGCVHGSRRVHGDDGGVSYQQGHRSISDS